jgi:predicted esterase
MTNPHCRTPAVRIGPSITAAEVVVVAVHGRGQSAEFMVEHLVHHIDDDRVAWVLPSAHEGTWYPLGFLAPRADNEPRLSQALAALDAVAASIADVPAEHVVWAGFSQGACLVSEWVARHPQRWGGLVALTGGRIGPPGTDLGIVGPDTSRDPLAGMPAYFGVGDPDEWVPVDRVHDTAAAYGAAGAEVTVDVFPGKPHDISAAEVARARAVIDSARRTLR